MTTPRLAILALLAGCGDKKQPPPPPAPTPGPVLPAKPVTPVAYEDYPVGVGPCRFVGIKEISEIVGAQMQYIEPAADDIACHLLPAIGHAAARMVTADEIRKETPDLFVYTVDPGNGDWSGSGVLGIGDKAIYNGTKLAIRSAPWFFNIELVDPSTPADALKTKLEAIAKKLVARGAATH